MKKVYLGICIAFFCFFLVGCNGINTKDSTNEEINNEVNNENDNEKTKKEGVDGMDVFDFYFINRAPAAKEKHPLNELIKIYFSTKSVAIDLGNNELYEIPRFSTNGVTVFEDPLRFDDNDGLLEILEKYNVQQWQANYTAVDPDTYDDGYGWMMLLQFEDGTVERYQGSGPSKEDVVPENFDEFAEKIETFKKEKVKEARE